MEKGEEEERNKKAEEEVELVGKRRGGRKE